MIAPTTISTGQTTDFDFTVTNATQSPTTQVTITFPVTPAVSATDATSPAGWSSTVYAETGSVTSVVYSEGSLAPGASAVFTLNFTAPEMGALMTFKVQQSYTDGTTTTPDNVSVTVDAHAASTTTVALPTTSSTFVSDSATSTTSTTSAGAGDDTGKSGSSVARTVGRVLVGLGVVIGITMYLRMRRVRK